MEIADERIEQAVIGMWCRLGGWMGGWDGGVDCLNAHRRPCVSRLPILWEIRAREAVRLPGKIPVSKHRDLTF